MRKPSKKIILNCVGFGVIVGGLIILLFFNFSITGLVENSTCNENSTRTIGICKSLRTDDCYIFCQDYQFKCINNNFLPVKEDNVTVCHDKGWVDPRTGVKYE